MGDDEIIGTTNIGTPLTYVSAESGARFTLTGAVSSSRMRHRHDLRAGDTIRLSHNFEAFQAPFDGPYYWTEGDNFVELERPDQFDTERFPLIHSAQWIHIDSTGANPTLSSLTQEVAQSLFTEEQKAPPPNVKANMGYIQLLMSNYGFKLSVDQIHELAKSPDKSEINKKMAEFYEKHKAGKPLGPEVDEIISQASGDLQDFFRLKFEEKKLSTKRDIDALRRDADKYFSEAQSKLIRMNEKVIEYDQLKETGTDVSQIFDPIKENTFWRIEKFQDGIMYFESQDVILRYADKAQGIDMTVNFGPMWAMWMTRNGTVKMDERRAKYTVDGYPHPHVSNNGSICWGNAAASYSSYMKSMNISEVLKILQSLLQTYNPGSPYQRLDRFFAKSNPSVQKGEFEHRPVRWAWVHCGDDDFEFSPDFADDPGGEEYFDDEANRVRKIRVFHRFNREFGIQIDEHEYIRSTNYRYFVFNNELEVDEDYIGTQEYWEENEEE